MIQTRALVRYGMLTPEEREWLNEIYDYNPLVFDYAVKRTIRHPKRGIRFPASVFMGADLGPAFLPSSVWQEHPPSKGYDEPLAGAPPTGVDGPRFVGSSGRS